MRTPRMLPLSDVDEVRAELDDTTWQLDRLNDRPAVDPERRDERRQILTRWHTRLTAQLADMEAHDA